VTTGIGHLATVPIVFAINVRRDWYAGAYPTGLPVEKILS